jgi:hypothetical protein
MRAILEHAPVCEHWSRLARHSGSPTPPATPCRRYQTQTFNATANQATSSLLFLSCIGIIIPTAATSLAGDGNPTQEWILETSRGTAVVMLLVYACYLVSSLVGALVMGWGWMHAAEVRGAQTGSQLGKCQCWVYGIVYGAAAAPSRPLELRYPHTWSCPAAGWARLMPPRRCSSSTPTTSCSRGKMRMSCPPSRW